MEERRRPADVRQDGRMPAWRLEVNESFAVVARGCHRRLAKLAEREKQQPNADRRTDSETSWMNTHESVGRIEGGCLRSSDRPVRQRLLLFNIVRQHLPDPTPLPEEGRENPSQCLRMFTVIGDKVDFDPQAAAIHWRFLPVIGSFFETNTESRPLSKMAS